MLGDKRLQEFLTEIHQNRVVQIKRDVCTRSEKVHLKDVLPKSRWQNGLDWTGMMVGQPIASEDVRPALEMRIIDEEGLGVECAMYGNVPDVLTGGRALNEDRIIKLDERTLFSKLAATYLLRIATML